MTSLKGCSALGNFHDIYVFDSDINYDDLSEAVINAD